MTVTHLIAMKTYLHIFILVMCTIVLSAGLRATPIYFTFSGLGSGNLAGTAFNDVTLDFQLDGDTSNITHPSVNVFNIPISSGTVTIANLGTANLTLGPYYVFCNQDNSQGISGVGFGVTSDYFDITASGVGLESYELSTSFGPISGSVFYLAPSYLSTSRGLFSLSGVSSPVFQAVTNIPEPSTFSVFLLGAIGMSVYFTKKQIFLHHNEFAA
jgi:hypothetical protein